MKADAAWRSYDARGHGIVWAVVDSGIDACHPHFSALELAAEGRRDVPPQGLTSQLHRDFRYLVNPDNPPAGAAAPGLPQGQALSDQSGHGTHVAGVIAGCSPEGSSPLVADSREAADGGYARRARVGRLSGMAPACELVITLGRLVDAVGVRASADGQESSFHLVPRRVLRGGAGLSSLT